MTDFDDEQQAEWEAFQASINSMLNEAGQERLRKARNAYMREWKRKKKLRERCRERGLADSQCCNSGLASNLEGEGNKKN